MGRKTILLAQIFIFLTIGVGCNSSNQQYTDPSSIIVLNENNGSEIQPYIERIRAVYCFQKWDLNKEHRENGYYFFEYRTLLINKTRYFHIELSKHAHVRPEQSTIPPPFRLAYFRVNPETQELLILDASTKQFLIFNSEEGQDYFATCLKN